MGLNIKSEEVHRLARQVAAETGVTMTAAIEAALREKLERLEIQRNDQTRIAQFQARLDKPGPPPPGLTSDHSDLYNEDEPDRRMTWEEMLTARQPPFRTAAEIDESIRRDRDAWDD